MHFQISRDGQTYGPYTLEDLKRYVASGNVLLTDLAKSESMTEWLPVEQILAGTAPQTTAPQGQAYEPVAGSAPQAAPYTGFDYGSPMYGTPGQALASSPYPDAPNLHWGLVLLLDVVTCGYFMIIWNLIVNAWLKRVQPNANSVFFWAGAAAIIVAEAIVSIPLVLYQVAHLHDLNHRNPTGILFWLTLRIIKLIARYSERASLEEHFNGPEPTGLQLDPVMTFFFGGLYFQAKLNQINEMKQRARFSAQRPY